jgi:hypothetical protein
MALQSLPVSRLINVEVVLTPLAAQAQNLNALLVLGSSNVIDVVERIRTYLTLDEVVADFGTSSVEYLAALLWFEQSPQPQQLRIGRWAKTATKGRLTGGVLSAAQQAIAVWNAVITPAFTVFVDSVPLAIAPASFAAASNLNGIATLIQTALALSAVGATVVWDANNQEFVVESGTIGALSSVGFFLPPTAVGNFGFTANPANNDQITLNGTAITFKDAPGGGTDVQRGADATTTLASLLTMMAASVDAQLVKFKPSVVMTGLNAGKLYLLAATAGAGGNALTIVKNVGANITVSGATLAGGSGTDISGMAGLSQAFSGAYRANGVALETALAAATVFDTLFGQTWYALHIPEAVDNDHLEVAAFIEGCNNKHLYGVGSTEAGILSAVGITDIAYLLSQLKYNRAVVQYSSSNGNCIDSFLARAITVDYNGNSTVLTMMYKQEPGIVSESLTETQVDALEAKNCNVTVKYNNNTAIVEQGKVSSGAFVDEITGTDWLAVTIMTALYNLLYTTPTKIPQTDPGTNLLVNTIESICAQGVINGLLAPGVWNSAGFGTLKQGDFMPKGFYVYAPRVATQFQADREARKSVPIQVAAKLAGAIHTVDVTINVNR